MVAYQVPKLSDICGRDKTSVKQIVLEDVRNPFFVPLVGFLAFDCFCVFGMGKNQIACWLKNIPDRNPIFPCGFHANIPAVVLGEPVCEAAQIAGESGKTLSFVSGDEFLISGRNTGYYKRLVDINSTADRVNDFRHSIPS